MTKWHIPHDERHRFLVWGPRDKVFHSWCQWFEIKGVEYEISGGAESWTIYIHQNFVEDYETGKVARCCPMKEEI